MQGIEFDLNNGNGMQPVPHPTKKGFSPFLSLLKKFGIDDPAVANIVLVCFSAVLFGVALFIYAGGSSSTPQPTQEQKSAQLRLLSEMQNPAN